MGLPLYEKSTSNGLLNTLLDDNRPLREGCLLQYVCF